MEILFNKVFICHRESILQMKVGDNKQFVIDNRIVHINRVTYTTFRIYGIYEVSIQDIIDCDKL